MGSGGVPAGLLWNSGQDLWTVEPCPGSWLLLGLPTLSWLPWEALGVFLVSAETLLPQVLGAGTQVHLESSMAGPGLAPPENLDSSASCLGPRA